MGIRYYDGNKKNAVGTIVLRDGIRSIDEEQFSKCEKLEKIFLPESVTSIGKFAFHCCSSLKEIKLPDSVNLIGEWAFGSCISLTEIKFPKNLMFIGQKVFYKCDSLSKITYHKNTEKLLKNYFGNIWDNLEKVVLYENLKRPTPVLAQIPKVSSENFNEIADKLLKNAQEYDMDAILKLKAFIKKGQDLIESLYYDGNKRKAVGGIILEEGITTIYDNAFKDCEQLEKIILPESLTKIGDNAFEGCSSLTEIVLPKNLISIGNEAFKECSNLKEVVFDKNLTSIDRYAFMYCENLVRITYHRKIEFILKNCFGKKHWDNLEKRVIDE